MPCSQPATHSAAKLIFLLKVLLTSSPELESVSSMDFLSFHFQYWVQPGHSLRPWVSAVNWRPLHSFSIIDRACLRMDFSALNARSASFSLFSGPFFLPSCKSFDSLGGRVVYRLFRHVAAGHLLRLTFFAKLRNQLNFTTLPLRRVPYNQPLCSRFFRKFQCWCLQHCVHNVNTMLFTFTWIRFK